MKKGKTAGLAFAIVLITGCGQPADTSNTQATTTPAPTKVEAAPISTTWALETNGSQLSFASIKAGEVIETHYIPGAFRQSR